MAKAKTADFGKPKWKCPVCKKWTRNEMGRSCAKCAKAKAPAPPEPVPLDVAA
jgi:hypothetical protein